MSDMLSQMFEALTREDAPVEIKTVSRDVQVQYLLDNVVNLTIEDRKNVCRIIYIHNNKYIKSTARGVIVNLNELPDSVINETYTLCQHIINNYKSAMQ